METDNSFEVTVRKKIPYLTTFLLYLLVICSAVLFIIDLYFLPARYAFEEMKTVYWIFTPNFIKTSLAISGIGFLIILPLYVFLRLYRRAVLTFLTDRIEIVGKKIRMEIPVNSILKVHCVDARTSDGQINEQMTIYFHQKRVRRKRERITRVRLRYYLQADEFMTYLLKYENINFDCSDFDVHFDVESEE